MHFDALLGVAISGFVFKVLKIKLRSKVTVDASKKVQIERAGQTQFVIIRREHPVEVFYEVCTQNEDVAGTKVTADGAQKAFSDSGFKVTDRAAEKKNHYGTAWVSEFRCRSQSMDVRVFNR